MNENPVHRTETTTVGSLVEYLLQFSDDTEVRVQFQPNYPLIAAIERGHQDPEDVHTLYLLASEATEYGDRNAYEDSESLVY